MLNGVDAVCHLATSKEDRAGFIDVSIRGTYNLLEGCRTTPTVKQFILAGGDAALGIWFYSQPGPLDENAPLRAYPGCYALSKVMEETLCRQFGIQYDLPYTILRLSWLWADDDSLAHLLLPEPNFGVPDWRELADTPERRSFFEQKRPGVACLRHPGGAPYIRHVVAVEDAVSAFLVALEQPTARGETFNIAASAPVDYAELARYAGQRLKLPVVDFELDGFHDFSIDTAKAQSRLGWHPERDGLAMIDAALAFREAGGKRETVRYQG